MERQEMDIEKRALVLRTQEPLETAAEWIRGNNNRERSQRIGALEGLDFLHKGHFEIWMERTGDYAKHSNRLRSRIMNIN